jgi:hypothetical protein
MKEENIYKVYRRRFLPVYADYVALKQEKPEQILIEESNILSHLSQCHNKELQPKIRDENLRKAYSHLCRASLDLQKLVWAVLSQQLRPLMQSDQRFIVCFNMPEGMVLAKYNEFREGGRRARAKELTEVGVSPLRSAVRYARCNKLGFTLLSHFDEQKHAKLGRWKYKESVIGFMLGIAASYAANQLPLVNDVWGWTKTFRK